MSSTALFRTEAEIDTGRASGHGPSPWMTSLGTVQAPHHRRPATLEAVWEELQAELPAPVAQTFDWAQGLGTSRVRSRRSRASHRGGYWCRWAGPIPVAVRNETARRNARPQMAGPGARQLHSGIVRDRYCCRADRGGRFSPVLVGGALQRGRCCCSRGPASCFRRRCQSLRQAAAPACAEQRLCRKTWRLHRALRAALRQALQEHTRPQRAKARRGGAPRIRLGRSTRRTAAADRYFLRAESPSVRRTGREGHASTPMLARFTANSPCSKATIRAASGLAMSHWTTRCSPHLAARAVTTAWSS